VRHRALTWGVVAAGLYISSAVLVQSAGLPVFPLFDGFGPPEPYRWVSPPREAAANNQPPLPGSGEVSLTGTAQNFFVTTEDGQASLAGLSTALSRQPRGNKINVNIAPLDPQSLAPPPRGLVFDGNAYEFEAAYAPSGEEAVIEDKVQVIFRYPRRANVILQSTGSRWRRLESFVIRPSLQVYTEVNELGTFVAAMPPTRVHRRSILPWIASAGAGVAVAAAGVAFFLRKRSRGRRQKKRRPPTKKRGH
jgi:hypothetical protein